MEFKIYEIPNNIKKAVYILFKDNEVVYVGQTINGLKRIFQHGKKDFNKYAFIETEDLEYYEDFYIMKYQPKYNRSHNHYRLTLKSAYLKLSTKIKNRMDIFEFANFIQNKGIKLEKFKNKSTIIKKDYENIKKELDDIYGEN